MPHLITPASATVVCTATHIDGEGTNNAQTSYKSVFDWNDGRPSIFATAAALRYARMVATNTDSAGKRKPKAKKAPRIRERGRGKSSSFAVPIATREQSDRTNSISR